VYILPRCLLNATPTRGSKSAGTYHETRGTGLTQVDPSFTPAEVNGVTNVDQGAHQAEDGAASRLGRDGGDRVPIGFTPVDPSFTPEEVNGVTNVDQGAHQADDPTIRIPAASAFVLESR